MGSQRCGFESRFAGAALLQCHSCLVPSADKSEQGEGEGTNPQSSAGKHGQNERIVVLFERTSLPSRLPPSCVPHERLLTLGWFPTGKHSL